MSRWLAVLCVGAAAAVAAAQTLPPERPDQGVAFRAGIDIVSLNVTVTDPANRYVTDLDQDDFLVFEDGMQQSITFFTRTQIPLALALLIDTSASMEGQLGTAQEAAIGFVRRLRENDLAQIIDFDSRVQIRQTFTSDQRALESAIRETRAGGSTSLYNAIYISLKELQKIEAHSTEEIRRQAIIVLSDGEDTSSLVGFDEVLELAKRSETAVYTVGLRSGDTHARRGFQEAEFVLRRMAQETGGRSFFIDRVAELEAVYGRISEELSSQYTLGYTSSNPRRDGMWRRVVVRIQRPNTTAHTKQGYYAPSTH